MKFSIVTPSYNQGRYVRDCITSVQTQAGVEWEHLVQDAGSTDETPAVLKEFPHLKCFVEPDRGMSDGINKGFGKATGDWLMWLNTDDYLLPGALAKVADFAARHPKADVIYGDCVFVDGQKKMIRHKREQAFDLGMLLFYGCYIPSTSTFLNRRIIAAGDLVDINYKVCMDFEYYLRLSRRGYRFEYLPEDIACFRWHEVNTSNVLAKRRHAERVEIQRTHLNETGRGWLGREFLLTTLFRLYQVKRALRRFANPARGASPGLKP